MSIKIDVAKCQECGRCQGVCPGNLLDRDQNGKALIKYPRDCWGCTACVKECRFGAIKYFLGPDIGGRGTYLHTTRTKESLQWHFVKPGEQETTISVNKQESNKY